MGHGVGRAEGDGWSASTTLDPAGELVYGPYTRDLPPGACVAVYRMMIDDRSAGSDVVVRIDVNDFDQTPECGNCVIAHADIRRDQFAAAYAYQDFALPFTSPGALHRLEVRTAWRDTAYIREDRITVRCPP